MKNLAGVKECDKFIQIELKKANIPIERIELDGSEVPYTLIGELKNWKFRRRWYYWCASTDKKNQLPLSVALEMHNKKYPDEMFDHGEEFGIYGRSIRVGGHCGCLSPEDYNVTYLYHIDTQEGLNEFARVLSSLNVSPE